MKQEQQNSRLEKMSIFWGCGNFQKSLNKYILFMSVLFCAHYGIAEPTSADIKLEQELVELKCLGQNTPAEFMANRVSAAHIRVLRFALCEKKCGSLDQIRNVLQNLRDQIKQGLSWPRLPEITIPHTMSPPNIDGNISVDEWTHSRVFRDEFPLNYLQANVGRAEWYIQYDDEKIYWAAKFKTSDTRGGFHKIYDGNALELFISGDIRLHEYCEAVVDVENQQYTAWNVNKQFGTYDNFPRMLHRFESAARRFPGGYMVECSLPWGEIPGFQPNGRALPGLKVRFMLVRTFPENGRTAPAPLLYDGHNITGHFIATLERMQK